MTQEPSAGALTPAQFIAALFGAYTDAPIFICSLPNADARDREGGEKSLLTRTLEDIDAFVRKHDRRDRGLYFSVGPLRADATPNKPGGSRRLKSNVAAIVCLHADVDLKSVLASRDEILEAVRGLPHPPSLIVDSGNGLHLYWLLSEAIAANDDTIVAIEALNDQLADLVGGDTVRDVCRLMRLPGSHNTKDGAFKPVTIVEARFEPRYELDDLEEMLHQLAPVIKRKPAAQAVRLAEERNPFELIAEQFGFKPSIDVEAVLGAMAPGNVHNTILRVSASMMARGAEPADVVAEIMPHVERAAGTDYNARRARLDARKIEGMCRDWSRKHPPEPQERHQEVPRGVELRSTPALKVVHQITEERAKREPKAKASADKDGPALHIVVGQTMLDHLATTGEAILFTDRGDYRYRDGLWSLQVGELRAWLDAKLQAVVDGLSLESTNRLVAEARGWVLRQPSLRRDVVPFDEHGMVPTRSGLIDPRTLDVVPARPDHYCTWRVECDYDPAATCPTWERMLADTFADRAEGPKRDVIGVLQEAAGAGMLDVKPRGMSRAVVFVGSSNSGKSGLIDVIGGLYGPDTNSASLDQLEGTHGLMSFMRRIPWVLHEAFNQSKWHTSSTVKAIITGDPVPVNIKNGPILTKRITAPIFWATNSPPQFKETTLAVVNRLVIIPCRRVFDDRDPIGTALEAQERGYDRPSNLVLATERPGLLNWALAGMQRALARGAIAQTQETREAGEEMHRDSNMATGFIADCVEFDADFRVSIPDFCLAFSAWFAQEKGIDRNLPANESIAKAVVALNLPRLAYHPLELRDKKRRYYCGVKLNAEGQEFWRRGFQGHLFANKLASTTPEDGEVNTVIPSAWLHRPTVVRMQIAAVSVPETGQKPQLTPTDTRHKLTPFLLTPDQTDTPTDTTQLTPGQPPDPFGKSQF